MKFFDASHDYAGVRILRDADNALHRFTDAEITALERAGRSRRWSAGEPIVHRGDPGDEMFVIVAGEVEVVFEDGRDNLVLHPGSFFGELAYINPAQRRTKTVLARTDCELRVLDQADGDALLQAQPRAFLTLLRRTVGWLVASEETLISDLQRKNRELERTLDYLVRTREELTFQELLARTDELTGLYNRRCLLDQTERFIARADGAREGLALLMIDLDRFKLVNDTLGHAAGDQLLVSVAAELQRSVRRSDLPCRLGGDEFAVLMADVGPEDAAQRGQMIVERLSALPPLDPSQPWVHITASVGGVMYGGDGSAQDLLARADEQLYAAKRAGKARLCWSAAAA